jgi:glycine betaine/proline transport system ATP-binding protein
VDASKPAIEIRDLYKIYGHNPEAALDTLRADPTADLPGQFVALRNVNLSIEPGKIYVIMGLSGSGKSTLLRCINRLVEPTGGRILIGGQEITGAGIKELRQIRSKKIGMVFQHFALLPHMSVVDNVAFGLRVAGVARKVRRERAEQALELVGLGGWGGKKPSSLSGGMRQRVGLARALVMDTPVLLMDEPFSALDPLIREEMQQELLRLQATLNKTIVFVTHDPNEAATIGDRIAILLKGSVVQDGHPMDIVLSPANDYVRNFVRGIDVFKVLSAGQVVDTDTSAGRLALSQDAVKVGPSQLIAPYLDHLAKDTQPIAVVREDGSFAGLVTKASLVRALAKSVAVPTPKPSATTSGTAPARAPVAALQRAG